jgi:hypothetical protein
MVSETSIDRSAVGARDQTEAPLLGLDERDDNGRPDGRACRLNNQRGCSEAARVGAIGRRLRAARHISMGDETSFRPAPDCRERRRLTPKASKRGQVAGRAAPALPAEIGRRIRGDHRMPRLRASRKEPVAVAGYAIS